jgi:hypothetical protein
MTPKQEEALRDYLRETVVPLIEDVLTKKLGQALTFAKKELAEQPAQQDSTCSNALRAQGKAYPRTCKKCGLGPCIELAQQALDKKAENARELGLDYEPVQDSGIVTAGGFDPRTQRTWVGLTDEERDAMIGVTDLSGTYYYDDLYAVILLAEGKLKEKNK